MNTLPLSDVKARLSEIVDRVDKTHERVVITKNGRNAAMLLSVDDWESLVATLDLLSDPAAVAAVDEAQRSLDAGEPTTSVSEMDDLLEARRKARDSQA